jgi:hypothetical protein
MPLATARALVQVRRLTRSAAGRAARRVARIAAHALVYGAAPAVASDALLDHKALTAWLVMHNVASSVSAAALSTSVHDVAVLARAMRL